MSRQGPERCSLTKGHQMPSVVSFLGISFSTKKESRRIGDPCLADGFFLHGLSWLRWTTASEEVGGQLSFVWVTENNLCLKKQWILCS